MRSTSPPKSAWPRRIDDVDARRVPEDGRHLGQDGDAALALEVIRVERALRHPLIIAESSRLLQQPIDQRGLAVIDMGNDADIAQIHDHPENWPTQTRQVLRNQARARKGPLSPAI